MIRNMVSGLSMTDIALLTVSATKGEFEAGMKPDTGYTR